MADPTQPTLTKVLEALEDHLSDLSNAFMNAAPGPDKDAILAEFHRVTDFFHTLDENAPLCLWQDPDVGNSWKCQLWAGHRQDYHSCS